VISERHQLQDQNAQLQHRIAEMLQQRRADDTHREDHSTADQEKRYLNYMGNWARSGACTSEGHLLFWFHWNSVWIYGSL